ncbi:MAG: FMN-binding negative transcriptional regulator [Burkholderiales bacterium]|nr:FMN-binding negative transcriptional regulator [Burkholderiales bacterium]MDP3715670.1 FMN-binding negative transcriptional regulator [Burkholderiales bacterium]
MYEVAAFRETRIEVMHALIRAHPLALLSSVHGGVIEANHLPLLIEADPAPDGTLRGHVARSNPLWRQVPDGEVLAVFQGPQAYVTPSWYPSKREHGKVVPTWNYVVVHVRGPLVIRDDRDWLRGLVSRLTGSQETGRPQPWGVGDAPTEYIDRMLEAIVGIEIPVTSIEGKWKVSQNRAQADRDGVAAGFRARGDAEASLMARLVDGERPV